LLVTVERTPKLSRAVLGCAPRRGAQSRWAQTGVGATPIWECARQATCRRARARQGGPLCGGFAGLDRPARGGRPEGSGRGASRCEVRRPAARRTSGLDGAGGAWTVEVRREAAGPSDPFGATSPASGRGTLRCGRPSASLSRERGRRRRRRQRGWGAYVRWREAWTVEVSGRRPAPSDPFGGASPASGRGTLRLGVRPRLSPAERGDVAGGDRGGARGWGGDVGVSSPPSAGEETGVGRPGRLTPANAGGMRRDGERRPRSLVVRRAGGLGRLSGDVCVRLSSAA
jgi:hypothetical protein